MEHALQMLGIRMKAGFPARQPVISIDTKKKELVGHFKNNGHELRPEGNPEKVQVHDFAIPELDVQPHIGFTM